MSEKKFEFPKLPELPAPPKGFELPTGRAGGNPGTPNIEEMLPALPPDLPLPRFLVKQMRK